ncbi:MAG: HI0074 family nucleotidyltransferase substrate-binding subunit [Candidatus Weimeria sp.]
MAYRFEKRFNSFKKSLESLKSARDRDWTDDFVLSGTGAIFCITFELAWKTVKDIMIEYYGIDDFVTGSPKDTLRRAFKIGLIDDDRWLKMSNLRNEISHDYDLDLVEESMPVITGEYVSLFEKLVKKINSICDE